MTTPCPHLEKLVNTDNKGPNFESVNHRVDKPIDNFYYESNAGIIFPEGIKNGRYEAQFRNKLRKAGLPALLEDILVHRFIYEDSLEIISQDLKITSLSTVHRLLNEALEYLKKRGFSKR